MRKSTIIRFCATWTVYLIGISLPSLVPTKDPGFLLSS